MITKIKVIALIIIVLIVIAEIICGYIYVNNLNNQIANLNTTVNEQKNTINTLNDQIVSLKNNIESFRNTLNITNDYINSLEVIYNNESNIKDAIYEEVISDPEVEDWFNQQVPDGVINIISNAADGMCGDSL